ncbi:MAG TPA: DUF5996 family protein, partial [Beijerinckiaceae bacterium]|nr:DUF5996 family protein [Beijerinckiaceae bacterium]
GNGVFTITFDLLSHQCAIQLSDGRTASIALEPRTVADFYRLLIGTLHDLGIDVRIWTMPVEVPDPIPFEQDTTHHTYDPAAANAFFRMLLSIKPVLERFRCGFMGKCSPVHFFWGSFDLAVTRFSGRPAPPHPGGVPGLPDAVTREAYSHEVASAGFWPGNDAFPHAAFYAYAYPEPAGFRDRKVTPGARFEPALGEFILPYDTVRAAADPDALLLDFLWTTYAAAADAGHWDRAALECPLGVPGQPRPV